MVKRLICALCILASTASADIVTYDISGEVRAPLDTDGYPLPVSIGDRVDGSISFDLDALPDPNPINSVEGEAERYPGMLINATVSIGGELFTSDNTGVVVVRDDFSNGVDQSGYDSIDLWTFGMSSTDNKIYKLLIKQTDLTGNMLDSVDPYDSVSSMRFVDHDGFDHLTTFAFLFGTAANHTDSVNVDWQTMQRVPLLPGDANMDGAVTAYDLNVIGLNWQRRAGWEGGDFTGDGFVDSADLNVLAVNWRSPFPAAVPEPNIHVWILTGVCAALLFFVCIGGRRNG